LAHVQKDWPRAGILRVEIVRNAPPNYSINDSYEKEYHDESMFLGSKEVGLFDPGSRSTTATDSNTTDLKGSSADTPDNVQYVKELPDLEVQSEDASTVTANSSSSENPEKSAVPLRRRVLFGQTISDFELLAKVGELCSMVIWNSSHSAHPSYATCCLVKECMLCYSPAPKCIMPPVARPN